MNLYDQIKEDEGVVFEIYLDHLGNKTFGVGHLVTRDDPEFGLPIGTPVSKERVYSCYASDLSMMIDECDHLFGSEFRDYPEEVRSILVNMMFNLGRKRLGSFVKMRAAISTGDWKTAAMEGRDSRWYRQVTNRAERLMSRLENVE